MPRRTDSHSARKSFYGAPLRRLNPDFKEAACDALRQRKISGHTLAILACSTQQSEISKLFNAERFSATPLIVKRLQRVADVVGYHGELFAPEISAPEVSA
jgi:hypothetical protein